MRRDSDRQRLAGVLGADRVSSGDCAEETALADLGRHATLEPAGAHRGTRKDGARDSTAMEIQPAEGGWRFKLQWTELWGTRSDSAGVAGGPTPKTPEEQAGARRKSTKRPGVPEDQWVISARVRSRARSQCRRNGRRGNWRQGPIGSKVRGVRLGRRHSGAALRAGDTDGGPGTKKSG